MTHRRAKSQGVISADLGSNLSFLRLATPKPDRATLLAPFGGSLAQSASGEAGGSCTSQATKRADPSGIITRCSCRRLCAPSRTPDCIFARQSLANAPVASPLSTARRPSWMRKPLHRTVVGGYKLQRTPPTNDAHAPFKLLNHSRPTTSVRRLPWSMPPATMTDDVCRALEKRTPQAPKEAYHASATKIHSCLTWGS